MAVKTNTKSPTRKMPSPQIRIGKSKFNSKLVLFFAMLFVGFGVFVVYFSHASAVPQNGRLLTGLSQHGTDAVIQNVPAALSGRNGRVQPTLVSPVTKLPWINSLNTKAVMVSLTSGAPMMRTQVSADGKRVYLVLQDNAKTSDNLWKYTVASFNLLDGSGRKDVLTVAKSAFILDFLVSSDGQTIAFRTVDNLPDGGQHHGLFTASTAGVDAKSNGTSTKELSIPEGNVRYTLIGFTQDNKLIYDFGDHRGHDEYPDQSTRGIYISKVDGSDKVYLGSSVTNALAFSPIDNTILAYNPNPASITVYNLDGSIKFSLNPEIASKVMEGGINSAGWSPDGKRFYINGYIIDVASNSIYTQVIGTPIVSWLPL